jgi:hypothetical protein
MHRPETKINKEVCSFLEYRDSAVGMATGYRLDDRGVGVHPTSYPMDTEGSFPGGKATRA